MIKQHPSWNLPSYRCSGCVVNLSTMKHILTSLHFSKAAKSYDAKPWQKKLLGQASEDLREHRHWLGLNDITASDGSENNKDVEVKLLDYACGPGTVSYVSPQEFAGFCLSLFSPRLFKNPAHSFSRHWNLTSLLVQASMYLRIWWRNLIAVRRMHIFQISAP